MEKIVIINVVNIVMYLDDVIVLQVNVMEDVNWVGLLKFVSKVCYYLLLVFVQMKGVCFSKLY